MTVKFIILILFSYLAGAIPFSFLIAKLFKGIDLRKIGSGNPGATNVYRTCGLPLGMLAFIMDAVKGILAVGVVTRLLAFSPESFAWAQVTAFFFVVIGHNWTVFLGFKGGKGIATSSGGLIAIAWQAFVILLLIWGACLYLTRYVSLSSIIAAAAFPAVMALFKGRIYVAFAAAMTVMAIYRHKDNIARLLKGQEKRIHEKKQGPDAAHNGPR